MPWLQACSPGESRKLGSWLIHYSTDYVFDGSGSKPWVETDPTGPLVYTARPSWKARKPFALRGAIISSSAPVGFMLHVAATLPRPCSALPRNASVSPSSTIRSAPPPVLICWRMLPPTPSARPCRQPELSGLYHLVAGGETSWHGYACFVLNLARQAGIKLKVDAENVIPVPTSAFPLPARRPLNSRLDARSLQTTFDVHLPLWRTGVARMLTEILEKRP